MEKQGTVYMIPCKDCSRPYIGETKQPLGDRVKQHKAKTAAADMLNGPAYHTFHHDHKVDFEGALILDTEKQTWLRKTKEALFIRAANPGRELTQVMNQDRGYTISKCWDWAIPETRRKMEWAQRKKNPRPSDHS
jgi:predicted GIY-YIG superfamily endonuclease